MELMPLHIVKALRRHSFELDAIGIDESTVLRNLTSRADARKCGGGWVGTYPGGCSRGKGNAGSRTLDVLSKGRPGVEKAAGDKRRARIEELKKKVGKKQELGENFAKGAAGVKQRAIARQAKKSGYSIPDLGDSKTLDGLKAVRPDGLQLTLNKRQGSYLVEREIVGAPTQTKAGGNRSYTRRFEIRRERTLLGRTSYPTGAEAAKGMIEYISDNPVQA
jgi:hypothetical protein